MPPRLATSLPITNHGINHGISNCSILIAAHPDALKSAALAISEEAWSHNRVPLDHSFGSWLCVLGFNEPFHRLHVDMRNREQPVVETDHHQSNVATLVAEFRAADDEQMRLTIERAGSSQNGFRCILADGWILQRGPQRVGLEHGQAANAEDYNLDDGRSSFRLQGFRASFGVFDVAGDDQERA
ncbi:hypothetical protein BKA81DRAFT_15270 [Phyllosticta paracitricarpa]